MEKITPETMKRGNQSENKAQSWMRLVKDVNSGAVESNTAREPGMLDPWIMVNWTWSAEDDKSEHWHFRNQWTKRDQNDKFNSDDHCIYYCGHECLRRNGVPLIVNKNVQNTVLWCSLKNNRMILVCFQSKPFNITVIQVCPQKLMLKKLKLTDSMKT